MVQVRARSSRQVTFGVPVAKPVAPSRPRESAGKRWRRRRNAVIAAAAKSGCSIRLIADAFDLPHSRVSAILKELWEEYDPAGEVC